MDEINLNHRDAVSIVQEDSALTFLKPYSGEHIDSLIVIYEDAYGDTTSGVMHRSTIEEKHSLDEKIMTIIFNTLM